MSFLSTDPQKNFALEMYGKNSRCFDHTNQMWEERTCKQVRQWQHWGSGCYQYKCEAGRLHIMVNFIMHTVLHMSRLIKFGNKYHGLLEILLYSDTLYR